MNRREAIKALAMLPAAGLVKTEGSAQQGQGPHIVGVKETPWLKCKVKVFCNGIEVKRCIRCSVQGGWCELFPENSRGESIVIYGDVRIERKESD